MDSSSTIVAEYSSIALSERRKFLLTYIRDQPWSLPDSIIYYISKNPSTAKVYQKMIQSCKYFFIKNSFLVISDLNFEHKKNQWNISLYGKSVDLNSVSSKFWITGKLRIDNDTPIPLNSLTTILSKIYQSNVKELTLQYQKIYITDLQFLAASKCEEVTFHEIIPINENDSIVGLEEIIEVLPKIKKFVYTLGASGNVIKLDSVQKMFQVQHFSNLEYFMLREIPEHFDMDIFYDYIKRNKKTKFYLKFVHQLSQEYRNRLQTIVNKIAATQNHDYKVPFIAFSGIDLSYFNTLVKFF